MVTGDFIGQFWRDITQPSPHYVASSSGKPQATVEYIPSSWGGPDHPTIYTPVHIQRTVPVHQSRWPTDSMICWFLITDNITSHQQYFRWLSTTNLVATWSVFGFLADQWRGKEGVSVSTTAVSHIPFVFSAVCHVPLVQFPFFPRGPACFLHPFSCKRFLAGSCCHIKGLLLPHPSK